MATIEERLEIAYRYAYDLGPNTDTHAIHRAIVTDWNTALVILRAAQEYMGCYLSEYEVFGYEEHQDMILYRKLEAQIARMNGLEDGA